MIDPDGWPSDYFASRDRFVELARAADARVRSRAVEALGPCDEPLSIDVATLGPASPEHLIVLVGGLHGVEGFLGARVQMEALRGSTCRDLPDGVGIALIHAANPWGFAHLRRVDEANADVNRNFIGASVPAPACPPGYAELDPIINPRTAPGLRDEIRFWLDAGRLVARDRGIGKLAKAIAEGQYDFPEGLFFGGRRAGEACRAVQDILLGLCEGVGRVTVLDVHSGLGPRAVATLIAGVAAPVSDARADPDSAPGRTADRLRARYARAVHLDGASGNAYDARGTFSRWCREALADRHALYLCVEIGTVGPLRVLSALRRENRAHHRCPVGSAPYVRTKRALLDVFAPRSRRWRTRSVAEGMRVLERTLATGADPRRSRVDRDRP